MLPDGSLIGINAYEELPQIRLIASRHGIKLGAEPTHEEIHGKLFPLGKGKVYGANAEELQLDEAKVYADTERLDAVDELLREVQLRSVHSLGGPGVSRDIEPGIFHAQDQDYEPLLEVRFAGTERWNVRRAAESLRQRTDGLKIDKTVLLAGRRPHDDKAGSSPYVDVFKERNEGCLPVEFQLLALIGSDVTGRRHDDVVCVSDDLDDNAREFARRYQQELEAGRRIYIAGNAAAVDKFFQIRARIREVVPGFDSDPQNPQLYFSSDGFQVGRRPNTNPAEAQRYETFLSFIPRLVLQLHELKA